MAFSEHLVLHGAVVDWIPKSPDREYTVPVSSCDDTVGAALQSFGITSIQVRVVFS